MLMMTMRRVAILLPLVSVLLSCANLLAADEPTFYYHATVNNLAPHLQMTEILAYNISRDPEGVLPIAGAEVCIVWNFIPDPLEPECNTTDRYGNVPFFRKVEQTSPGYPVRVDVTVDIGDGPKEIEPIIFTPI